LAWHDQLLPAEFAGRAFGVLDTQVSGGMLTADETQVGRGSRVLALAPGAVVYNVEAYLVGDDALTQVRLFTERLDAGVGLLVHPHYGSHDVVCRRWAVQFEARVINYAQVSIEFVQAEIVQPDASLVEEAADTDELKARLAEDARGLAGEETALNELALVAPDLGLELEDADTATTEEREEFAEQATRVVLEQPQRAPAVGIALTLSRLAGGIQLAAELTLDAPTARGISSLLLREALRTNSLTLMAMRDAWMAFVRTRVAPLRTIAGRQRPLLAIARAEGLEYAELAGRNREAAAAWWAAGEVKL
jgi:hypothetical protein